MRVRIKTLKYNQVDIYTEKRIHKPILNIDANWKNKTNSKRI